MGQVSMETLTQWPAGVNTSLRPDEIPKEASPRAWNNMMLDFGQPGMGAVPSKRLGCRTMNVTPITGSPAVIGQFEYNITAGNGNTRYHVLVGDNGSLSFLNSANVAVVADATNTSPFTVSTVPSIVEAANMCFFANGADLKKLNGTSVQNFGITAPVAPTIADAGVSGLHNGTYEARATYYNSVTGVESSASPTSSSVSVTNHKINWTWSTTADSQVDTVRLYLRNTGSMAVFYQAASIPVGTAQPYATSVADSSLVITAPTTSANNPPLATIHSLAWHQSRLFAADNDTLYFSQPGVPEQFDPNNFERVNPQDGQKIVALASSYEMLLVLKRNSLHILSGGDPASWTIAQLDPTTGCVSQSSVVKVEGTIYWWSDIGPMVWYGWGLPQPIGLPSIAATISRDNINVDNLGLITAAVDYENQIIMWAVPGVSAARNTFILPYSYRLQQWVSDKWDPMDVASLGVVKDTNDQPWVYLGGYAGQVFRWWDATSDGMRDINNAGTTLTKTGTVTTGTSVTSLSTVTPNGTVVFDTDGGGLIERYITIQDTNGISLGRQRITSNSSTAVTLANAINGLAGNTTYTWSIGGPDWQFDTHWAYGETPFHKKRYTYMFFQVATSDSTTVHVDFLRNIDLTNIAYHTASPPLLASSGLWDVATWDNALFGATVPQNFRLRIGLTGRAWLLRFRSRMPDHTCVLYKVAVEAELLTTRS